MPSKVRLPWWARRVSPYLAEDRESGTHFSDFSVPTCCGKMKTSAAFSVHNEPVHQEATHSGPQSQWRSAALPYLINVLV